MATTQIDSEKTSLCERVKYFSDWYHAKRAIALCIRYIRRLRALVQKKQCKEELTRRVKVTDLESAERAIIRAVQTSAFKEELDPDSPSPLTPNQLLTMKPKVVLARLSASRRTLQKALEASPTFSERVLVMLEKRVPA